MNERQFWGMIAGAARSGDLCDNITSQLMHSGLEEVVSFKQILLQKLAEAYTFPLLAANFAIQGYVSDDGFLSFRAWLVSKGYARYTAAVSNPESIADWLERDHVSEIDGEDFLRVADDAYAEMGGNLDELYNSVLYPATPKILMDWPENKAEFEKRYPRLVTKFWDQARIGALHSD